MSATSAPAAPTLMAVEMRSRKVKDSAKPIPLQLKQVHFLEGNMELLVKEIEGGPMTLHLPIASGKLFQSIPRELASFPPAILVKGVLPNGPISFSEEDRGLMTRLKSKDFSPGVALDQRSWQVFEDMARMGLKAISFTEAFVDGLDKAIAAVDWETQHNFLLYINKSLSASTQCLSRLYTNTVLTRRDAVLSLALLFTKQGRVKLRSAPIKECILFSRQGPRGS